jgi:hypothetical protein
MEGSNLLVYRKGHEYYFSWLILEAFAAGDELGSVEGQTS